MHALTGTIFTIPTIPGTCTVAHGRVYTLRAGAWLGLGRAIDLDERKATILRARYVPAVLVPGTVAGALGDTWRGTATDPQTGDCTTCEHKHLHVDLALTCARRLARKPADLPMRPPVP